MEFAIFLTGFILGAVLGSGALAISERSLKNKTFFGRSFCPKCKKTLVWYDLIPIFSYLLLQGKCRYCHKKIPLEYLLVEIVMALLIGALFWKFLPSNFWQLDIYQNILIFGDLFFKTFFVTVLAIVTITDLKDTFIPDRVILPSIVIALAYLTISTLFKIGYLYIYLKDTPLGKYLLPPGNDYFRQHVLMTLDPLVSSIVAGILISGFFMLLIIITKGRGMGGGDVKLGAFMGLGLGLQGGVMATILGFLSGAVISVFLLIFGKKHFGQTIPFGPFLVLGSLIVLFWGNEIFNWYLNLS